MMPAASSPLAARLDELLDHEPPVEFAQYGAGRDVRLHDLRRSFEKARAEKCRHALCYSDDGHWDGCFHPDLDD